MSFTILGNTAAAVVTSTQVNTLFQFCNTNTFRIVSNLATTSDTVFVGVFSGNTATSFHHPVIGGDTGQGIPVVSSEAVFVTGNFGISALPGNVTVAAITSSGAAQVYITPVKVS